MERGGVGWSRVESISATTFPPAAAPVRLAHTSSAYFQTAVNHVEGGRGRLGIEEEVVLERRVFVE